MGWKTLNFVILSTAKNLNETRSNSKLVPFQPQNGCPTFAKLRWDHSRKARTCSMCA
jgi:hypothetical protein